MCLISENGEFVFFLESDKILVGIGNVFPIWLN